MKKAAAARAAAAFVSAARRSAAAAAHRVGAVITGRRSSSSISSRCGSGISGRSGSVRSGGHGISRRCRFSGRGFRRRRFGRSLFLLLAAGNGKSSQRNASDQQLVRHCLSPIWSTTTGRAHGAGEVIESARPPTGCCEHAAKRQTCPTVSGAPIWRSTAWKRGSARTGSSIGSCAARIRPESRCCNADSRLASAPARSPHCASTSAR